MGSPPASLRPTPPLCDYERGFAPQREQRPESDLPSADAETYMLVGLRRSLASDDLALAREPQALRSRVEGREHLVGDVHLGARCAASFFNARSRRVKRSRVRRRSTSSLVSPGPRPPLPPASRDSETSERCASRGSRYLSCASSTWSLRRAWSHVARRCRG